MGKNFLAKKYLEAKNPMGDTSNVETEYSDLLNLSIGDPDLNTNEKIIDAAAKDAKNGYTHYTDAEGYKEFREEIVKFYKREYDLDFNIKEVMATSGACHALYLAFISLLNPDEEVIVPDPFFPAYKNQIEMAGGKPIFLPVKEEENFEINIEKLKALINEKTKAILINSPNNPTGVCYSDENLKKLLDIAKEKDILIITDEVYDCFSYEKPFKPLVSIKEYRENIVTIGSFSKDFAMTGWRIGFAVAPDYIINCMKNLNENICFSAASVSQRAAIYALKHRDELKNDIIDEYKKRVYYSYERINSINNIHAIKPQGSIYVFVNIKKLNISSRDFAQKLLKEERVQVIPGSVFGKSGEGYIRIACTLKIDKLQEAFQRLERFCKNYS